MVGSRYGRGLRDIPRIYYNRDIPYIQRRGRILGRTASARTVREAGMDFQGVRPDSGRGTCGQDCHENYYILDIFAQVTLQFSFRMRATEMNHIELHASQTRCMVSSQGRKEHVRYLSLLIPAEC